MADRSPFWTLHAERRSFLLGRARIAAALGRRVQALTLLAAALDEGSRFLVPAIREYGEFASLRRDAEFRRLMTLQ